MYPLIYVATLKWFCFLWLKLHVVAALLFKHKRAIPMPEVYNNKLFHDGQ
jgi:hypothetical protein